MANPDKFLRLRDYARLERAQKDGVVDGTKFAYDSAKHVVSTSASISTRIATGARMACVSRSTASPIRRTA